MTVEQEKALLIEGITLLKNQLLYTRGARCTDLLDRLEALRNCLEVLIRNEINTSAINMKEAL